MKLDIVPNDVGGYAVTCAEFPGIVVNGPTFGLAEALALDAFNEARHARDIQPLQARVEAAEDDAVIAAAAGAIARKRGRPKKVAAVPEGADVE